MIRTIFLAVLLIVPSGWLRAGAAAPATDVSAVKIDEAWDDSSGLSWNPAPAIETENGQAIVRIVSTDAKQGATLHAVLDTSEFKGQVVVIDTRVRADNISDKPDRWNGIKMLLHVHDAKDKDNWLDVRLPVGTFGWTPVRLTARIPADIVAITLVIGLEKVTGTVYFDALHISATPAAASARP